MLKKLLKYDLRATFKYWWIAALSSIGISVIGGLSLSLVSSDLAEESGLVMMLGILGIVLSIVGISAFLVSAEIFVYLRFYQNFFTDEGYLTFTLPVKRHQLLNSKIITAFIVSASTLAVVAIDAFVVLFVHFGTGVFDLGFWSDVVSFLNMLFGQSVKEFGAYPFIYALEIILLLFIAALLSVLLIFGCITFAAMITKKNKVLAAIGVYYVTNAAISLVMQIVGTVGLMGAGSIIPLIPENIPENAVLGIGALCLLLIVVLAAAIAMALYTFVLWMLDRKLNLA